MSFFSFQLSRLTSFESRSRGNDINLVSFGVLVNKRDHGRFTAVTPMFKGHSLHGREISEGARANGLPYTVSGIAKNWEIGPIEVTPGDSVDIVTTLTNTGDSQLPSAHQQAVDDWTIKALNVYYSWLLGQFVSGLGLKFVSDFTGTGSDALRGVAAFLADPIGTLLGYEKSGPCNGVVVAEALRYTDRELEALTYRPELASKQGQIPGLTVDRATVTNTHTAAEHHNTEGCGAPARTEVELAVRRYPYWSWRYSEWDWGEYPSVRGKFPQGGSLKELTGVRR